MNVFVSPEISSIHSSQAHFGLTDPEEFIPKLVGFLCDDDQVRLARFSELGNIYFLVQTTLFTAASAF
jgi:hypothetical protein